MNWIKKVLKFIIDLFTMPPSKYETPPREVESKMFSFCSSQVGVDISHHNKDVDLETLADNVDFIYMKATEGETFVSSAYEARAEQLKVMNKIPWGVYHYYRIAIDPIKQANHFLNYIDAESELPPVLDIEREGNTDYKYYKDTDNLLLFLNHIEEMTGVTPIIYTNFFFARDKIKPDERFEKFPLWLAWYTNDFGRVQTPEPWSKALMWQRTEYGRMKGVDGHVNITEVL